MDRLSEIEQKWAKTTPGPWRFDPEEKDEDGIGMLSGIWAKSGCIAEFDDEPSTANANAIAAAPSDIAWLIQQLRDLREWQSRAAEVLEKHLVKECDSEEWQGVVCMVCANYADEFDEDGNIVGELHMPDCALSRLLQEARDNDFCRERSKADER